jgi:branched-chain amino acid aminotransferase
MAKIGGAYMNSQLIKMEALVNGYSEGIALDASGYIGEGSGENLFLVHENKVYTPGLHNAILGGVTRKSVIKLAGDLGYEVVEGDIMREMLYLADELFFTGTAAEITPIRSVDKMIVGKGMPGKITKELQEAFFDVVKNGNDKHGWLTFIDGKERILSLENIQAG